MNNFNDKVSFIWSVADLLRGPYKPAQYGDVMLPLVVLRRLDCVLDSTKPKVLERFAALKGQKHTEAELDAILNRAAKQGFHNRSKFDFEKLKGDAPHIRENLLHYIGGFSKRARDIFAYFGFEDHLAKLEQHNRLYLVVAKFAEIDLHPEVVSNTEMGYIFEELIRKFKEQANEEAGDHFTPREVIRLMVNLLFDPDGDVLTKVGVVRTLFDPACGTGGMLSVATDYLRELNPDAKLEVFGQEYNDESYAICSSDMLIKGQSVDNIKFGDSFTQDGLPDHRFHYLLANPPFGVEWKPEEDDIRKEAETQGFGGRFGAGLPRINDGSFLFLQHMIAKMIPAAEGGSRIGIVFNGSPLFTGDAGSGESNIRKWIIEHDWLDAIVALPDQLFYNTGISTYLWIVTNRKRRQRQGKVQLINAVSFYQKMRKSLGNKRNEITDAQIQSISHIYGEFVAGEYSKIFDNADFGYWQITVERPLRLNFQASPERIARLQDETAFANLATSKKKGKVGEQEEAAGRKMQDAILALLKTLPDRLVKDRSEFEGLLDVAVKSAAIKLAAPIKKAILSALSERDETAEMCRDKDGNPEPDSELRDYENIPLKEDIHAYFAREVLPHVPDAWIDASKTKVGYEIPFNRHFYQYTPPRPLAEIEADIKAIEQDILQMLREVAG
jgi:type I restriction enzyme M protein